ncbi:hypothetical protein FZEAL_10480 [Fusarium zealandicum]|uniref:Uncharacterized protein n=1 Tax=Fusarium zealandicum TaxID=1053134 RepID=A0A8H4XB12_9HYPO|nr:hypothetical protein FZEAL_10480 [Fusarium zealandicum]
MAGSDAEHAGLDSPRSSVHVSGKGTLVLPSQHANLDRRRKRSVIRFHENTGHFPCDLAPHCIDTNWNAYTFLEKMLVLGFKIANEEAVTFDRVKADLAERVKRHRTSELSKLKLRDVLNATEYFFPTMPEAETPVITRGKRPVSSDEESDSDPPPLKRVKEQHFTGSRSTAATPKDTEMRKTSVATPHSGASYQKIKLILKSGATSGTDEGVDPTASAPRASGDTNHVRIDCKPVRMPEHVAVEQEDQETSCFLQTASVSPRPTAGVNTSINNSVPAPTADMAVNDLVSPSGSSTKSSGIGELNREINYQGRKYSEAIQHKVRELQQLRGQSNWGDMGTIQESMDQAMTTLKQLDREYVAHAKAQVEAGAQVKTYKSHMDTSERLLKSWKDIAGSDVSTPGWALEAFQTGTRQLVELKAKLEAALFEHREAAEAFTGSQKKLDQARTNVCDLTQKMDDLRNRKAKWEQSCDQARALAVFGQLSLEGIGSLMEKYPGIVGEVRAIVKDTGI